MTLITKSEVAKLRPPARKRAVILVFEGVQIIDFTGPYEVLGQARFEVSTVAASREPLTTAMGLTITPTHDFSSAPTADVVVVPGGSVHVAVESPETIAWLQAASDQAEYTMSVCNGAFILAKAGLLDGGSATTFYGMIDDLRAAAPKTKVVADQRFVDNGRIMTTAGLSSGIDGTLHLIEKLYGHGRAQEIALHIEYDWQPESGFARAALADMLLPRLRVEGIRDARTLSTEGTRQRWKKAMAFTSDLDLDQVADRLANFLTETGWKQTTASTAAKPGARSTWTFDDKEGRRWKGMLSITHVDAAKDEYEMTVTLERAG